ncbi:MAG: hypothetical protein QW602_03495, partial [Candidatus Aenigmatarchaeota archaeon]
MNKKLVIIFSFIFFTFPATKALQVLSIDYTIFKNDTVLVNSVKVFDSKIFIPPSSSDEYKVVIKDFRNETIYSLNIPVLFYIFDFTGGTETNSSFGYLRVEWKNTSKYIDFLHNNRLIHSLDLSDYLCFKNNLCEELSGETFYTCLSDCHCGNEVCEENLEENYENCPQDCKIKPPSFSIYIYFVVVAIILALIFIIVWKSRRASYE